MNEYQRAWRAPSALLTLFGVMAIGAMATLLPAGSAKADCLCRDAPYLGVLFSHGLNQEGENRYYHDGKGEPFHFVVTFNKDVVLERRHVRVDGGRLLKITNSAGEDAGPAGDQWRIKIRPRTEGRMTITFPAGTSWTLAGDSGETVNLKDMHRRYVYGDKLSIRVKSAKGQEKFTEPRSADDEPGGELIFAVSLN